MPLDDQRHEETVRYAFSKGSNVDLKDQLGGEMDNSKFSDQELVGMMEWSLPSSWRAKFDQDSYIPTFGTRAKLISECKPSSGTSSATGNATTTTTKRIHKKKTSSANLRAMQNFVATSTGVIFAIMWSE
jgi:hypothetical protein